MEYHSSRAAQAVSEFALDWSRRGASFGDPIINSQWNVPAPLVASGADFNGTRTWIDIGGGRHGTSYRLANTVWMQSGLIFVTVVVLTVE